MYDSAVKAHYVRCLLRAMCLNAAVRRAVTNNHMSPGAWVDSATNDLARISEWHHQMWLQGLAVRRVGQQAQRRV